MADQKSKSTSKQPSTEASTPSGKKGKSTTVLASTEATTPGGKKTASTVKSTEATTPGGKKTTSKSTSKQPSTKQSTPSGKKQTDDADTTGSTSPTGAHSEASDEASSPRSTASATRAPGRGDSQYTTTSMVTTTGTEKSTQKPRGKSKIDAANVYVYGPVEEPWQRRDKKTSDDDSDVTVRPNRAHTMRQSCIMRRAKAMERERLMKLKEESRRSSMEDDEVPDPIVARKVPKNVYDQPKVPIKETKSSKFRYLYNRKPPGVKVYFKPAKADPKKKPPFVVFAHP